MCIVGRILRRYVTLVCNNEMSAHMCLRMSRHMSIHLCFLCNKVISIHMPLHSSTCTATYNSTCTATTTTTMARPQRTETLVLGNRGWARVPSWSWSWCSVRIMDAIDAFKAGSLLIETIACLFIANAFPNWISCWARNSVPV